LSKFFDIEDTESFKRIPSENMKENYIIADYIVRSLIKEGAVFPEDEFDEWTLLHSIVEGLSDAEVHLSRIKQFPPEEYDEEK
jgi:hypothetical protein